MNNERKLADIASINDRWREAAHAVICRGDELSDHIEHRAQALISDVITHKLAVGDLREEVSLANLLDREAVETAEGNIDYLGREDFCEALARRIAHHAGRQALSRVKNHQRRQIEHIQHHRQKRFGDYALNR